MSEIKIRIHQQFKEQLEYIKLYRKHHKRDREIVTDTRLTLAIVRALKKPICNIKEKTLEEYILQEHFIGEAKNDE